MCVVSMVMEHKFNEWQQRFYPVYVPAQPPYPLVPPPSPPMPTQEEVDEFRRLLERAREYDRKNGEPDCELVEKRQKLQDMADSLGIEINFGDT